MNLKLVIIAIFGLISNSTGVDIVERLKNRYDSVETNCTSRGKEKPAYQCFGIMIRGVNNNLQFAWDMKNLNKEKAAFSLAYLRSDQVFSSLLNYDSGFIIYPHSRTPRKKNKYEVICSFPINAGADNREGRGCGKTNGDETGKSNHCDVQNIKSFEDWKSHFYDIMNSTPGNFSERQCGFDMTTKRAIAYLNISLEANRYIKTHSKQYAFMNNELRMHVWNVEQPRKLPIEAFFYFIDSVRGRRLAEEYQDTFYARSGGEVVPIVGIGLPSAEKSFQVESYRRRPRKHN